MAKVKVISSDWRDADAVIRQLISVVKSCGLKVYDLGKGSDMYVYVISKKKMSRTELEEYTGG